MPHIPRLVVRRNPDGALAGNGAFMLTDAATDATLRGNKGLLQADEKLDAIAQLWCWVKWMGDRDRYDCSVCRTICFGDWPSTWQ